MRIVTVAAALMLAIVAPLAHAQPDAAVTPEKLALAHQIVQAAGGQERIATSIQAMMNTLDKGLEKNMPADQARLMELTQSAIRDEMAGVVPAIVQATERIYAQDLTTKEMADDLAWMGSESGRSIRQKTPMMLQQVAEAEVPVLQAMLPRLSQRIVEKVCAEAKCSEHDRQLVMAAMAKAMNSHPG